MAKRKRNNSTEEKIKRWIKEGRGQGEGIDYKPWLKIQDVPSKGYSTRDRGWKTKRIHHFLSDLELNYFYTLEWSSNVVEIREQYPLLPLEKTLAIAEELGVEHPRESGANGPFKVITSDFFIVLRTESGIKTCIRTIKPVDHLDVRELEKFDIEKRFYKDLGIEDWKLVTDQNIPSNFIKNMDWFYDCKTIDNRPNINMELINSVAPVLYKAVKTENLGLSTLSLKYDDLFGLNQGSCLFIVKYLLANKIWETNINAIINPSKPLEIYDLKAEAHELLEE
ncbi:TnsA endonuclease N-terminal domain-containing protein [Neobacillus sp. OS1-2]|uniref:TnsA endonuclease N-terminal domain-containing protein n=1 Tax=Neobacillus sp. OS1-2 TaxID=3070680 RepID=UPI0027DFA644|nr:TnsA endonuclease N-terminal domain-containing protein [Neobacillus sp. OS1-2]WML41999.1 TnsA endonuclease N-terminal domain-containing protein [Neobacillus sp. OS1-2]